jgi:hypothetical protein
VKRRPAVANFVAAVTDFETVGVQVAYVVDQLSDFHHCKARLQVAYFICEHSTAVSVAKIRGVTRVASPGIEVARVDLLWRIALLL